MVAVEPNARPMARACEAASRRPRSTSSSSQLSRLMYVNALNPVGVTVTESSTAELSDTAVPSPGV